jgi:hypothetical protein
MGLTTTFSNLNSLTDISFIAGTDYTIKFVVNSQAGSPIDLSTATCKWYLAPYGTDFTVLRKTGSVIAAGTFSILLSANDTIDFFGKYTHQPSITFSNGKIIYPAQGIITILKGLS